MTFTDPTPDAEIQKPTATEEFFSKMTNIEIGGNFTIRSLRYAGYALAIGVFKDRKDVLGIKVPIIHQGEEKTAYFERQKWADHLVESTEPIDLFSPSLEEDQYLTKDSE